MSNYEEKDADGVTEYWKDGEKIAFLNEQGNLQATHGNAGEKEGLKAWLDAKENPPADPKEENAGPSEIAAPEFIQPEDSDPVQIHDHEQDAPPAPEPGTARFEFTKTDPATPIPVRSGPPPVPETEPRLIPGLGNLAPEYLWWAWHQPDDVFKGIYGKTKEQFETDHGGYLEKIRNRTSNGTLP